MNNKIIKEYTMNKSPYTKLAIGIFNELEKIVPEIGLNRNSVETFLNSYVSDHHNVIIKYGELAALDKIFIRELSKYYEVTLQIDLNSAAIIMSKLLENNMLPGYKKETKECVVLYPSFCHNILNNSAINHTQIIDIYILNGEETIHVNPGIIKNNMNLFGSFLKDTTVDIAEHWTKAKKATKSEVSLIADEILAVLTIDNKAAFKEDIIRYLADETNNSKLLRFL